jgi:hypothetical protein
MVFFDLNPYSTQTASMQSALLQSMEAPHSFAAC